MPDDIFDLTGKVAIVTGGNGGIGLGIAKGLAGAGANIVVAARDEAKTGHAAELLRGIGADVLEARTDVADEESVSITVANAMERFGRIDILVNNAGTSIRKSPQEFTLPEWDQIQGVNLRGTFICCRAVHPHMVRTGGGKIINIGSMFSLFGSDWAAPYAASKGGVVQLTKSLAVAWAKDGIQVNAILPGWIYTGLTASIKTDHRQRYDFIKTRIPHGRWGEPDELAGAAVFLSSGASGYVTGAAIPVDGGYAAF